MEKKVILLAVSFFLSSFVFAESTHPYDVLNTIPGENANNIIVADNIDEIEQSQFTNITPEKEKLSSTVTESTKINAPSKHINKKNSYKKIKCKKTKFKRTSFQQAKKSRHSQLKHKYSLNNKNKYHLNNKNKLDYYAIIS